MKRRRLETDKPLEQKSSTYATITDLPDELLAKIAEDLVDNEALCRLSLTCQRLHFLVLPMFFSRNDLRNPEIGSFHYYQAPPETLGATRTALFVRKLTAITFQFTSEIDQVISEMCSLRGLLARIPPVGQISLILPNKLLCVQEPQRVGNIERWGKEFLKLLGTIVKRGCRDLELRDPMSLFPDNLYIATSSPTAETTAASEDCRKMHSRAVPLKSSQIGKSDLPAHLPLTWMSSVRIISWRLFQPFFVGWIIETLELNRGSIVCIDFNVTSMPPALLSRVSESLNLPAVKKVNIASHLDVVWVELQFFLNRHRSITCLHLDGILPDPQYSEVSISLPCLTQLTATSLIVTWLLRFLNAVPLLTSVNVLLDSKLVHDFDGAL